jgi:hypothetical protein
MSAEINYLAVLIAGIASVVFGSLWYGPLFGKKWMAFSGFGPEKMTEMKAKGGAGKSYFLAFIGSLVMSYVLANALVFASFFTFSEGARAGAMVGFWNWLGFIAPVTMGSVLWEGKSWRLWFLNNAYYLVSLIAMGIILALWV